MSTITKDIKSLLLAIFAVLVLTPGPAFSQDIPDPMEPPRMVNDFAGFLDAGAQASLEQKLQEFYSRSSTQIYIITVEDLMGYAPGDYATRVGEKWGVGTKGKDNGIVILVKPKTSSERGEVFISVGYGLEGAVPDAIANRIIDNEIKPAFQEGRYAEGLEKATDILISITEGEYTAEQYLEQTNESGKGSLPGLIFLIIIMIILFSGGRRGTGRHKHMGRNLPFWLLLGMMGSGSRSHGGSFGGFSSGGGGFGGGGGGSFGGGGAGGSW